MPRVLSFFLCLLLLPTALWSKEYSRTRVLMGNIPVFITVKSEADREVVFQAIEAAYEKGARVASLLSSYEKNDIHRLNTASPHQDIPVGPEVMEALYLSQKISHLSHGAFDITYASVNPHISYRNLVLKPRSLKVRITKPGVQIDVSSVAKGMVVETMSQILLQQGYKNHLVNAGGDLKALGQWSLRLRNPQGNANESLSTLILDNQALASAGNYERGPHIFDPHAKNSEIKTQGVSVIHNQVTWANALATAAFVLGQEKTEKLLLKKAKACFIFY